MPPAIISAMAETLSPIDDVQDQLRRAGYLADAVTGKVVHLPAALSKPVLIEDPAGAGKTQLAKSVAVMTGKPLIRLQCYEGLDESKPAGFADPRAPSRARSLQLVLCLR